MLFLMFEKVRERGGKLLRFPHTAEVTQKYLFKNLSCFKLWECQAGWIGGSNLIQQQQDLEGLLKHRWLDSVPSWSPIIPNMFPGDADAVGPALRTTGLEKAWRASQPRIDLLSIKTELLGHFCNSDAMSGTLVKKESWGAMSPLDHLPPSHCPPPLMSEPLCLKRVQSSFISGVSLDLWSLWPGLWSGNGVCLMYIESVLIIRARGNETCGRKPSECHGMPCPKMAVTWKTQKIPK